MYGTGPDMVGRGAASVYAQAPPPQDTSAEAVLGLTLKHAAPSSEGVSELMSGKNSFGVAWLILILVKRGRIRLPLEDLDTSGCNLSSGKVFLLLESMPWTVLDGLTLGKGAVKDDAALIRLCAFFERRCIGVEVPGVGPENLKRLSFAEESLGPAASTVLFPILSECLSLEKLCVKERGMKSLREVDFGNIGVKGGDVSAFCNALIAQRPQPGLVGLSLGDNRLQESGESSLLSALKVGALSSLKALDLGNCQFSRGGVELLLGGEGLENLERLILGGISEGGISVARAVADCLMQAQVPRLKFLSLEEVDFMDESAVVVLDALRAFEGGGRDLSVELCIGLTGNFQEAAMMVGEGRVKCLRSLSVVLMGRPTLSFFRALAGAEEGPPWRSGLDLLLLGDDEGDFQHSTSCLWMD
uniref:Uncharacterized protein n=1 Tax=Chromera velia CCMP2878 TaxID=1169474 RepID=A0A0G4F4P0_9ALVE